MKRLTKLSFELHSYLGLIFGILYLFFGISGAILVFKKEIEYCTKPVYHCCSPTKKQVSVDEMYRKLAIHYKDSRQIMLNTFPRNNCDSYEFMIFNYQDNVADNYLYCCMIDPYTGKIVKESDYVSFKAPFFRWLYSAHYSLLMDKPGRLITAVVALAFILNLITGVIIYRKKIWNVITFKEKFNKKSTYTKNSSYHRIIGTWSLILNFLIFFTGFWMNKSLFLPSEWDITSKKEQNYIAPTNIDAVISMADSIENFRPIAVKIAMDSPKDIIVSGEFSDTTNPLYFGKGSDVYFDSEMGKLQKIVRIEDKPFSDRFYWAMKQLHRGDYDNIFVKLLYVFVGLSPAVLSITGFVLWKRKQKTKKKKQKS